MGQPAANLTKFEDGIRLNGRRELPVDPRNKPHLYFHGQRFTWEKGVFTVPDSVSEERVQFAAEKYRVKYMEYLETPQPHGPGFRVLDMDGPHEDRSVVGLGVTDQDRRRYVIWAKVTRAPVVFRSDVGDDDVPLYIACGWKLKE